MQIAIATEQSRSEIKELLQSQNLPSEDLPGILSDFYTVRDGQKLVGLIGMERYGSCGLLRSMVVHPEHRNKGIAEALVKQLEQAASATGITDMYILTETAEQYFKRKGYRIVGREEVPGEIKGSSEFSSVCPVSATVMRKNFAVQPETAVQ